MNNADPWSWAQTPQVIELDRHPLRDGVVRPHALLDNTPPWILSETLQDCDIAIAAL